jgi:hypothetical protein
LDCSFGQYNLCYLGCWTLDQPQMTYGFQKIGLWIHPKNPSLLIYLPINVTHQLGQFSDRPYNVFCLMPPPQTLNLAEHLEISWIYLWFFEWDFRGVTPFESSISKRIHPIAIPNNHVNLYLMIVKKPLTIISILLVDSTFLLLMFA